jgi:hypothetical protein
MIGGFTMPTGKMLKGALFTAFMLSLEILANHPQITYYAMMCLLVFIITEFVYSVREKSIPKFLKTSALLIIPFVIAIGINFASLYTVYEYGKYSSRGKSDLLVDNKNVSGTCGITYNILELIVETMNLSFPMPGGSKPFDRDSRLSGC